MWQILLDYHQRMGILPLKKRVNRDKCSFTTKHRMFGWEYYPLKARKSRQMQFRNKTACLGSSLSMSPACQIAHFMPPWFWEISYRRILTGFHAVVIPPIEGLLISDVIHIAVLSISVVVGIDITFYTRFVTKPLNNIWGKTTTRLL